MPNWCYSNDYIYGPTHEIIPLYNQLINWVENSKDGGWLKTIVDNAGLNSDKLYCRSDVIDLGLDVYLGGDKAAINFFSESAWAPCVEAWDAILKKYAPNCEHCYLAEEPGMGLYQIKDHDDHFFFEDEDYCLDMWIDDMCLGLAVL